MWYPTDLAHYYLLSFSHYSSYYTHGLEHGRVFLEVL